VAERVPREETRELLFEPPHQFFPARSRSRVCGICSLPQPWKRRTQHQGAASASDGFRRPSRPTTTNPLARIANLPAHSHHRATAPRRDIPRQSERLSTPSRQSARVQPRPHPTVARPENLSPSAAPARSSRRAVLRWTGFLRKPRSIVAPWLQNRVRRLENRPSARPAALSRCHRERIRRRRQRSHVTWPSPRCPSAPNRRCRHRLRAPARAPVSPCPNDTSARKQVIARTADRVAAQPNEPAIRTLPLPTTQRTVYQPPQVDPASPSDLPRRRTNQPADVAVTPIHVDSPTLAQTDRSAIQPAAGPTTMAPTKSAEMTNVDRSVNLDRPMPEDPNPSTVESGFAGHKAAAQQVPAGPSISPAEVARVPRSVGDRAPGTSPAATVPESASQPGAREPGELTASSPASLARADANPEPSNATRGTIEVDLRPARVLNERGQSRASGGGQPELNLDARPSQVARNRAGHTPQIPLTATVVSAAAIPPQLVAARPPDARLDAPSSLQDRVSDRSFSGSSQRVGQQDE